MEKFIPVSDVDDPSVAPKDPNYIKILNVASVMVRVTDEGHRLLPGLQAYVDKRSDALKKALSRGSIIITSEETFKTKEEKQPKKKAAPKARPSAKLIVAPEVSDDEGKSDLGNVFPNPKESTPNEQNDNLKTCSPESSSNAIIPIEQNPHIGGS